MNELNTLECQQISAGYCSSFEIIGYSFVSSVIAMGGVRALTSCSLIEGAQTGFACAFLSSVTALGLMSFMRALPGEW